jgi:hypothetical protein
MLLPFCGKAQDVILLKSGEEIQAKVLEVTETEIRYKNFNNSEGPTYTKNKADIFMIKYPNGQKDVFQPSNPEVPSPDKGIVEKAPTATEDKTDYCSKGKMDAERYYTNHTGAGTGTLLVSLLGGPLFGLIPAVATSATPPKDQNLGIYDQSLKNKNGYYSCYSEQARKKKSRKVWLNYLVGSVISVIVVVVARS